MLACTAVTTRPSYRPFPLAAVDTLPALPPEVITEAAGALTRRGLEVRVQTPEEGYLETRWFHPGTGQSRSTNTDPPQLVRLRVWADLVTPTLSEVTVEAVYRRSVDRSLPERVDELVAAPGTPGDSLAQALRRELKTVFGR